MDKRDKEMIWNVILAAFGITAAGLYFGLRRFLWRLWAVISAIWVGLWLLLLLMHEDSSSVVQKPQYWLVIVVPPVLLLLVAGLLNWIISGLRDDIDEKRI